MFSIIIDINMFNFFYLIDFSINIQEDFYLYK